MHVMFPELTPAGQKHTLDHLPMIDDGSAAFERMVARIHSLFESAGTKITWNDKVYGAADPEKERQVDVTIERPEGLVHVECRMHSRPQDVGWIEQLMGRRVTLSAISVIGVSSSGFTEGARRTGAAYGIVLRDVLTLTDNEILGWGSKVDLFVRYLRYADPELYFVFDQAASGMISPAESIAEAPVSLILADILNKSIDVVRKVQLEEQKPAHALIDLVPQSMALKGHPLRMVVFRATITCFREAARVTKVQVYGDPGMPTADRGVYVQTFESPSVQVGRMLDRSYLYLDFSTIQPPDDAQFLDVLMDMKRPGQLAGLELLAQRPPKVHFAALRTENLFGDSSQLLGAFLSERPKYTHIE